MMMVLGSYLRRWRRILRRMLLKPGLKLSAQLLGCFLLGFLLSAASLKNEPQPFALALLCAGLPGWLPLPYALGGSLGSWLLWQQAGNQAVVWIALGLPVGLLAQRSQGKLLQPMLAACIVAASGVFFQWWQHEQAVIAMYVLRIFLAFGATALFLQVRRRRDGVADWACMAIAVLALAQLAPLSWLNLGFVAAGALSAAMPFPAVALAGLALDLAQVTQVPMTAVLALSYCLRLLPRGSRGLLCVGPALAYGAVMALSARLDTSPIPALALGGFLGLLLPQQTPLAHRRGETGFAQVRLEMAAGVLAQSEQLLIEARDYPIDEAALMEKAAERACGCCPCRKTCKYMDLAKLLPGYLLHRPLTRAEDIPLDCRKRGRLLLELRRSQDQFRILKADRDRQQEYREAVVQQYRFLAEYLQCLSDQLPRRGGGQVRFQPEIAVCSAGKETANGDRCLWFAGTECRYYTLLCDGMGTGMGAQEEARGAAEMLRKLLMAGFPASYALRSFNSLCTLRGKAGAVTVDLAELHLDSGKVTLYKWGAAPSYLLVPTGPERIGSAGAPPGLSVGDYRETIDRLGLRAGETLVLLSDGVDAQAALQNAHKLCAEPGKALASRLIERGRGDGSDDATVAVIRLTPAS